MNWSNYPALRPVNCSGRNRSLSRFVIFGRADAVDNNLAVYARIIGTFLCQARSLMSEYDGKN
jgi:hypothetical protein